jgi:glutaminyl-tRNA synthetase
VIDNYPADAEEACHAPNHPQRPELGKRAAPLTRELWIGREDFSETPPKGYFRLFPGNHVRLRYGYIVKCTGCEKDAEGRVTAVHCEYDPDTKSGSAGADKIKVKGNIHWVSARHAYAAEVRLYDRLFTMPQPGAAEDFIAQLNPAARTTITAQLEPALRDAAPESRFQFERHGYFVADGKDTKPGRPVFNRTVTLRDSWARTGS